MPLLLREAAARAEAGLPPRELAWEERVPLLLREAGASTTTASLGSFVLWLAQGMAQYWGRLKSVVGLLSEYSDPCASVEAFEDPWVPVEEEDPEDPGRTLMLPASVDGISSASRGAVAETPAARPRSARPSRVEAMPDPISCRRKRRTIRLSSVMIKPYLTPRSRA